MIPLRAPRHRSHIARVLAVLALAAGCSATGDPATGDIRADLHHRDPRVRMRAAFRAAEEARGDLAGDLVANLADRDESVRFFTAIALQRLTGKDLGYASWASAASREEAIARWRRWLEDSRDGQREPPAHVGMALPPAAGTARGAPTREELP